MEGTLEKRSTDGYWGGTLRMLGMSSTKWKLRHYVLYDNHLFWGRGFSRMYGYATVLSAHPSPADGETAFVLELVTHPKFSLRRGGYDSLDYFTRLYGLCCSTHGYSQRVLRAGTVMDRDRWVMTLRRGLPPTASIESLPSPKSPAETIRNIEERSVFDSASVTASVSDKSEGASVEGDRRKSDTEGTSDDAGPDEKVRTGDGASGVGCDVELTGDWNAVNIDRMKFSKQGVNTRAIAREKAGLWTNRDVTGAEEMAAVAWEAAAAAIREAEHQSSGSAAKGDMEKARLRAAKIAATRVKEYIDGGVIKPMREGEHGAGEVDVEDEAEAARFHGAKASVTAKDNVHGGLVTPRGPNIAPSDLDSLQGRSRTFDDLVESNVEEETPTNASCTSSTGADAGGEVNDPFSDNGSVYGTADGDSVAEIAATAAKLVEDLDNAESPEVGTNGAVESTSAEEVQDAKNVGPGPTLRSVSLRSIAKPPAPVLRKTSSLTNDAASNLAREASERRVRFAEQVQETQLYAPTPTKKNPDGVGKTPARLAPFGGFGTVQEEDEDGEGVRGESTKRALQQAAGRWAIPPTELKTGQKIGSGSFGEVFVADWNGTEVALKQMHDRALTRSSIEEFSAEIRMMSTLRHPNIVLFLGAVIQGPTMSIVCELMPLGSLHSLLHGRSRGGVELSSNGRLRRQMAMDCARGMSYLHSRSPPVVHHDLKPANLLVDTHWTLKVSDFGMSRLKHNTYLSCKSPGGTPEWMAPEVLRNDPTDERSDIYSFGVVLWELMTLQYPWEDLSTPVQIVVQVAFLHRRPKIPEWLAADAVSLLQGCWSRDPSVRPTFTEVLEALKAPLAGAWKDWPPATERAVQAAAMDEKAAALVSAETKPKPAEPPEGASTGEVAVDPGDFVILKGLPPIKTPAPVVKKKAGRVVGLGPTHQDSTEETSSSEDDGEGPVGPQGYARAKSNGNGKEIATPRSSVTAGDRADVRGEEGTPVTSAAMTAAEAVMPKLPALKIGG